MKIGITADLHLTTNNDHPERYNAFVDILDRCFSLGVDQLILAGDVFDQSKQNYSEFESVCKKKKYRDIHIHLIPGNHDQDISSENIVGVNIVIHSKPSWIDIHDGWQVLFIPYTPNTSMGEVIQEYISGKGVGKWILVGHGDWLQGIRQPNPLEPGIYMPLTHKDITNFSPDFVFLGHIHSPQDFGNLYYPGSPCGLDITETGYRHFLILNSDSNEVTSYQINSDILYYNESFVVLPTDDETKFVAAQIDRCIESWNLDDKDRKKVRLKVVFRGYSSNRKALSKIISDKFQDYEFYEEPDISEVSTANDPDRNFIMEKFMEQVESLVWKTSPDEPDMDAIVLKAVRLVYGDE
ncbi:MAG: metallophosphoesterase [Anaerolineae bacterium]|nr:metallophosphoesterase [Anaerolineae bacterium]